MILQNQVRCLSCNDFIVSKHTHDYVKCKCGRVAVDGGMSYLRRAYVAPNDYEELSYCLNDKIVEEAKEEIKNSLQHCNELGILCAVIRVLLKNNKLVKEDVED